jgi:hypothetical protein
MKKIIFLTIFALLYLMSGRTASVSAATCPLRTEAPYRSWSRNSVFYITADCRRQPIRNPEVYFTYFESWNNVLFTSDELLYSVPRHPLGFLPWGPRKDYGNGSLIKTVTDDTVYIMSAGRLYPIGSEDVFHHLHLDWSWVEDVAPSVLNLFPMRTPLVSNSDYPEQFAFQYTASTTVYTLELSDTKTVTKQQTAQLWTRWIVHWLLPIENLLSLSVTNRGVSVLTTVLTTFRTLARTVIACRAVFWPACHLF